MAPKKATGLPAAKSKAKRFSIQVKTEPVAVAAPAETAETVAVGAPADAPADAPTDAPTDAETVASSAPEANVRATTPLDDRVRAAESAGLNLPQELKNGDVNIKDLLSIASDESGKTAKALREAFKRAQPSYTDPRTMQTNARPEKTVKMPEELAAMMNSPADSDWWLGVWLANDRGWLSAKSCVEDFTQEDETERKAKQWLTAGQMLHFFRDQTLVDAYIKELSKSVATHRKHPEMPWLEEGHQYLCTVTDEQSEEFEKTLKTGTTATADIDPAAAKTLIRRGRKRDGVPSLENIGPAGGESQRATEVTIAAPPQPPAQNEEAKRVDAAAKAAKLASQRAEVAKQPKVMAGKWLKGVTDLLTKVTDRLAKADKAGKIPNNMGNTYKESFVSNIEELRKVRSYLEVDHSDGQIKKKTCRCERACEDHQD